MLQEDFNKIGFFQLVHLLDKETKNQINNNHESHYDCRVFSLYILSHFPLVRKISAF